MDLVGGKVQKLQSWRSGALDLASRRGEEKLEGGAVAEAGGRRRSRGDGRGRDSRGRGAAARTYLVGGVPDTALVAA